MTEKSNNLTISKCSFLVPFIDTQPVVSKVKPLVGAGIYYKTSPGYGGFIGMVGNRYCHINEKAKWNTFSLI